MFASLFCGASLAVASATQAGPLLSATWSTNLQGIQLVLTNSGATCTDTTPAAHVQQTIACPTGGNGATGSATSSAYSVSLTLPLFSLQQFTTGALNIYTKAVLGSATADIAGAASSASATMFVNGAVTLKVAAHLPVGANASMLTPAATTLVKVPLSVGKAGTFTGYFYVLGDLSYLTVDFYGWTPHTLTFTGLTSKHVSLPTVVALGSFNLNGAGGGTVTLVSPSLISIDGFLAKRRTVSLTTLKLTYAPEPDTLLLLGAGGAGLVLLARRERR